MIVRIRRRFIRIAILVLALAMVLVAGSINAANWINVRADLVETLDALSAGGGQPARRGAPSRHLRNALNESRFFTVRLKDDGTYALDDFTRADEEGEEALLAIAGRALSGGRESGFSEDWLFAVREVRGERAAVFLNCESKLSRVRRLALISLAACALCVLLAWLLVALFSSRAIRPMVESAVQQKQFITDAGHELKTPLTVISANMDVLALETGPNEWVQSTRKQVANLQRLVGEMIYLSRLDEEDARLQRREVDLTAVLRESAEPFGGMAEFAGKVLELDLEEGVRVTGDEDALRRLCSILLDNAVKYAPAGDEIAVTLRRGRREARLSTENGLEKPLPPEALKHLFDRFYRADASRSKKSGGHGIGLSVARAIAEKHSGELTARQTEQGRLRFECRLPL